MAARTLKEICELAMGFAIICVLGRGIFRLLLPILGMAPSRILQDIVLIVTPAPAAEPVSPATEILSHIQRFFGLH